MRKNRTLLLYDKAISELVNFKPNKYEKVPGVIWLKKLNHESFGDHISFLYAFDVMKLVRASTRYEELYGSEGDIIL